MKSAAVGLAVLVIFLSCLPAAGARPPVVAAQADPIPTHIQLVATSPVTVGNPTTLLAVLHDTSTNQGISRAALGFYILTTFGWLLLGNQTTDDTGKAALDYTPVSASTYTTRVVYEGNATYARTNATATFTILPAAPTAAAGIPSDTAIALVILLVVGGVWATYGFVAWQILGIRANRPEESEEATRREAREVKESMEEESEAAKRGPRPATAANRTVLIIAVLALVLGGAALGFVGVQSLTKSSAYTPGTVNLQIAVVPDVQGSGWDVWLPNELIVHQGDTVKLTILNSDTMAHGFYMDAFGIDQALQPATTDAGGNVTPSRVVLTITPNQVGSFQFKCNIPCGPGHDYMVGTFVVLPD